MNIALLCQNVVHGAGHGRVNCEIAEAASRKGHHVWIISDTVERHLIDDPNIDWIHVDVEGLPTQIVRDQVFARRSARWLKQNRARIDLVFTTGFVTWAPADVVMVQYVHGAWIKSPVHTARVSGGVYGAYHWVYSWLNARLEQRAFRQARTIVAVSEAIRDELVEIGVASEKILVELNGVDLEEFFPAEVSRADLGLPQNVRLGLFAGDIRTPRKNLDTVLKAMVGVPNLHLAVAGNTDRSPYPALAQTLGLSDRVHFLGFRRDVPALMRASDVFVFPSRYEACALVLVEALASGLPVVTAESTGGAEIVAPDCGVRLKDPNDVDALATALRYLVDDPDRLGSMRIAARRVASGLSFEQMANNYLDIFDRALAHQKVALEA